MSVCLWFTGKRTLDIAIVHFCRATSLYDGYLARCQNCSPREANKLPHTRMPITLHLTAANMQWLH